MKRLFTLASAALLAATPAFAQTSTTDEPSLSIGGALLLLPEYIGSKDARTLVVPAITFENIYGFDFTPFTLTRPLIETRGGEGFSGWSFEAGPKATFDFGRDEEDSPVLTGLGDVGTSFPIGGYAKGRYGPVSLSLDVAQDVAGGHGGLIADIGVGTRLPLGKGGSVIPTVTASYGSTDYMESFFGISADQALRSQFEAYDIDAGFHSVVIGAVVIYPLSDKWSLSNVISYRKYIGDAADSPILTGPNGTDEGLFSVISITRKIAL